MVNQNISIEKWPESGFFDMDQSGKGQENSGILVFQILLMRYCISGRGEERPDNLSDIRQAARAVSLPGFSVPASREQRFYERNCQSPGRG
jgi:hypothetical protein